MQNCCRLRILFPFTGLFKGCWTGDSAPTGMTMNLAANTHHAVGTDLM